MCVKEWLCMSLYYLKHSQVPPCWILLKCDKSCAICLSSRENIDFFHFDNYSTWWHLAMFQIVQTLGQLFFYTHQYFQAPILYNRKLYVNMGADRGGLLLLDHTVWFLYLSLISETCSCSQLELDAAIIWLKARLSIVYVTKICEQKAKLVPISNRPL